MSTNRWASSVIDSQASQVLRSARAHGPLSLIATPWQVVATRPLAQAEALEAAAELADFDQIPLTGVDGHRVESMFVRGRGVVPLHAGMFMAADSSLMAFVETADHQNFRLLIDAGDIVGLATLSDLQRLPVYSLLFGLVIAVEALLVECIRRYCSDDSDAWLRTLSGKRRETIESYFARSRVSNVAIDRLSCASLTDEIAAAVGLGLLRVDDTNYQKLKELVALRDDVCHAKEFASTPELALKLPQKARDADALAEWLQNEIKLINQTPA